MALAPHVYGEIAELLRKAEGGDFLVKSVSDLFVVLRKNGLLTDMRLPPMSVGVHPQNRDGLMLNAADVHQLLDSISQVGFVPARIDAIAVEIGDEEHRVYNQRLVDAAGGALGTMDSKLLKVLSLSASHTNFVLRLVACAARHDSPDLSVNGLLSLQQVRARDSVFAEHVEQGLSWRVISKEVAEAFPKILQLIQASQNATLQKAESEVQLLRRIFSLASNQASPDFQAIKKMALSSKPPCGDCFAPLYNFALRFCGGSEGSFLRETEIFIRSAGQSRSLGLAFWEVLSQDFKRGAEMIPHFRHGLLKVALTGSTITVTQARKMFSRESDKKVTEANHVLFELRELVKKSGVDILQDVRFVNILGVVDINVVRLSLGLPSPEQEKSYKTVQAIAHDACLLLQLQSPWAAFAETTGEGKSSSQAGHRMRELNPDGSLRNAEDLLKDQGFVIDTFVRRKADKLECQIKHIGGNQVQLEELHKKGLMKVSSDQFLSGKWHVFTPRKDVEVLQDLSVFGFSQSIEYQAALMVAEIHKELEILQQKHDADGVLAKLTLQLRPHKALVVKEKVSKLVLVPCTWKIVQRSSSQGDLANAVKVETAWNMDDRQFWLSSCVSLPKADDDASSGKFCVSAFFLVNGSEEPDCINMEMFLSGSKTAKIRVPLLRNTVPLAKGDALSQIVQKKTNRVDLEMPAAPKRMRTKQ